MWVKICGLTRYEDALLAKNLGADAIGFVLTKSKRQADPEILKEWIQTITGIEKVGVFIDEDPAYIASLGEQLKLDTIQIHRELSPEHIKLADRFQIICAMKEYDQELIPEINCRLLLDPSIGTGKTGCWKKLSIPFILAGGLTPDNVKEAISLACPIGVDVSSGVEIAPGIKDAAKIKKFIQEAKS